MSRIEPPKVDNRTAKDILRRLRAMVPHHTPEWPARDDNDPGVGLLGIFSALAEGIIQRINRAPERNFLSFLDMLGIRLVPERPARVPVRFLVAEGQAESILIKAGAQVSAQATESRPTELPYETIHDLQAVSARLEAAFVVHPQTDVILMPPPGFLLNQGIPRASLTYRLSAFSSAQSSVFQLDIVDDLNKGDILEVTSPTTGKGPERKFFEVIDVAGRMVTVNPPLDKDYDQRGELTKVTAFDLSPAGRNVQAHILYIGDTGLFNIKQKAEIRLTVRHHAESVAEMDSLPIVWEFFTEQGGAKRWQSLERLPVGTDSEIGEIRLYKPPGEIKEIEVDGIKSRWIRGRVPTIYAVSAPTIDSVKIAVSAGSGDKLISSREAGLYADLAFHNDNPLTVRDAFYPFGVEPKIFDRFYIGSTEAFSKLGAEATLTLDLEFVDLMASPAVVIQKDRLRIFVHGAAGRLLEFPLSVDPTDAQQGQKVVHGNLSAKTRIVAGSTPAPVLGATAATMGVFVRVQETANDGAQIIHLRHLPEKETDWKWYSIPSNFKIAHGPHAILHNVDRWLVFVVADGGVQYRSVDSTSAALDGDWKALGGLTNADSCPFALNVEGSSPFVFVTDSAKTVHWNNGNLWKSLPVTEPYKQTLWAASQFARPWAVHYRNTTRIFVRERNGNLMHFRIDPPDTISLRIHLDSRMRLASDPCAVETPDGRLSVFGTGEDGRLWCLDPESTDNDQWQPIDNLADTELALNPFAVAMMEATGDGIAAAFSVTPRNSLLVRTWVYHRHKGVLRAGPKELLHLTGTVTLPPAPCVFIPEGIDAGKVLKIARLGTSSLVFLDESLSEAVAAKITCKIGELRTDGHISDAQDNRAVLENVANVKRGDFLCVPPESLQIVQVGNRGDDDTSLDDETDQASRTVLLAQAWKSPVPANGTYYRVVRFTDQSGPYTSKNDGDKRLVLDEGASGSNGAYDGGNIAILSDAADATGEVKEYEGLERLAVLTAAISPAPKESDEYVVSSIRSKPWEEYQDQIELRPELSWEYWNGTGWAFLTIKTDDTRKLLVRGEIVFTVPDTIMETEIAGQVSFWIRARIVGGDYGREQFVVNNGELEIKRDPIRPPYVKNLRIKYEFDKAKFPQTCIAFNNLTHVDQTAANIVEDKCFMPFEPLLDETTSVYFGFDRAFGDGPVRLYASVNELEMSERAVPKIEWSFEKENKWKLFPADDETRSLTRTGLLTWSVPGELQKRKRFGEDNFWIRAKLKEDPWPSPLVPVLQGLFLNTAMAIQARTVRNEILGSSDGEADQVFQFVNVPVLEGEEVRVREDLTEDERQMLAAADDDSLLIFRDVENQPVEIWVRWREVPELVDSRPEDRHYRLDRASGEILFGDGKHGRIPPIGGDIIKAFSYQTGGGRDGNVPAGAITSLVTSVGGIEGVINPVPAGGGSERATPEEMLEIGPAQISNRSRAVSPRDFEWLAREASSEVRIARCVPHRNSQGLYEVGWITLYIVPDPVSLEVKPVPSLELKRSIARYLSERAGLNLAAAAHIHVASPTYLDVAVKATLVARSIDETGAAERNAGLQLAAFFHPATGGADRRGWDFGDEVRLSDLYALLEDIDEVDYVAELSLLDVAGQPHESIPIGPEAIVAAGAHQIEITVEGTD